MIAPEAVYQSLGPDGRREEGVEEAGKLSNGGRKERNKVGVHYHLHYFMVCTLRQLFNPPGRFLNSESG